MKKTIVYFIVLLIILSLVFAHGDEISEGKELVEKKAKCSELNDEQLEHIGDYLMEKMHPGEAHEMMDKAMGGEISEQLKQMHVNMAKAIYCGEGNMMQMMGGGMMDNNMMNGGMMNMMQGNMMNQGMMGNMMSFGVNTTLSTIINVLVIIALILLIVWLFQKVTQKKK